MTLTIEDALRVIVEKAAVVRLPDRVSHTGRFNSTGHGLLNGIGSLCQKIEHLTKRVKQALDRKALDASADGLNLSSDRIRCTYSRCRLAI